MKRSKTPPDPEIARRLRLALDFHGHSQADLADHLGVSEATVSQWLAGAITPRPARFVEMSKWLGDSVDWLMGRGEMERGIASLLTTIAERAGRDRLVFLASLPSGELREAIDEIELRKARAARRPPTQG